jgi:DNA polymerase I-like protein with 3'-5' exonuclease and polymerase domains
MNLPPLSDLPVWSDFDRVALDIETRDDDLKTLGPGVRRGAYITGVSFCCGDENGPAFYLPMRHEGGGNYDDPARVMEYLRDMARHFRGDIEGTNLQYDLDFLAEENVIFTPSFFRDIQVSGPLLDEPTMARMQDKETGKWFWGEEFHHMSLNAQAERLGIPGKDEEGLNAWAAEHGLNPKQDMWKAPAKVVSPYAIQDVRVPMQISSAHMVEIRRQGLERVHDLESHLLPVLLKMRRRGVAVDMKRVEQFSARAWALENKACREVSRLVGRTMTPDDTTKSAALAKLLEAGGVTAPLTERKVSQKTGKMCGGNPSVKNDWLKSLGTPLGEAIIIARRWNKIRTTFCESIQEHEVKGRIHCTFNQLRQEQDDDEIKGARFGRLSCTKPNLQQQPVRYVPEWRTIFQPDEGGQWACLDFAGQEPRMITNYAERTGCKGGAEAAEMCRTDPTWDNHSMMAGFCYGDEYSAKAYRAGDKAAKKLRDNSKEIFLGRCYGMGGGKLCTRLGLPTIWVVRDPEARRWTVYPVDSPEGKALRKQGARPFEMAGPEGEVILTKFDEGVPYVKQLAKMVQKKAQKVGYIVTLLGRRCRFPIHPETGKLEYAHTGLNRLIQGSSADQTKLAMVTADDAGTRMQLQVHDELDLTIWDLKEAQELNEIMVHAIELNVPTMCDIEVGPNWGELKAVA